jgi:hypothetical protein
MNYLTAAAVASGVGVIAVWLAANVRNILRFMGPRTRSELPEIEQRFRAAYSIMSEDRRQSIVRHYMGKHEFDRQAAMWFAMHDRSRDADRWAM